MKPLPLISCVNLDKSFFCSEVTFLALCVTVFSQQFFGKGHAHTLQNTKFLFKVFPSPFGGHRHVSGVLIKRILTVLDLQWSHNLISLQKHDLGKVPAGPYRTTRPLFSPISPFFSFLPSTGFHPYGNFLQVIDVQWHHWAPVHWVFNKTRSCIPIEAQSGPILVIKLE